MKFIDHHMHSDFSFDSSEKMENYLHITNNEIITTEHLDFQTVSKNTLVDRIPNYQNQLNEVIRLNKIYNDRVYMGLEVGYSLSSVEDVIAFLKDKKYDLVLLSVHQNEKVNYMKREKYAGSKQDLIEEYFGLMISAIKDLHSYIDVLAHFDFGFRVHDVSVTDLELYGKELFEEIVDLVIKYDIAFEMNSSSIFNHNNLDLYHWALDIYTKRGGSKFTLGSDTHSISNYQHNFNELITILKEYGVKEVVQLYGKDQGVKLI